jgi:hypothetical protein
MGMYYQCQILIGFERRVWTEWIDVNNRTQVAQEIEILERVNLYVVCNNSRLLRVDEILAFLASSPR